MDERVVKMNLANLRRVLPHSRALEDPETVGYIYGSLGALRRAGRTVTPDEVRAWALEAGWAIESAWALSGIALAVRDGLPDIGTLRLTPLRKEASSCRSPAMRPGVLALPCSGCSTGSLTCRSTSWTRATFSHSSVTTRCRRGLC